MPVSSGRSLSPGVSKSDVKKSSNPSHEAVPLFASNDSHFAHRAPVLPYSEASAEDVQAYLLEVCLRRGLAADNARAVASRWATGTGRELRTYPVATYREIFGTDGWILYKDIKTQVYSEEEGVWGSRGSMTAARKFFGLIFGLIMLAGLVGGGVLGDYSNGGPALAMPIVLLAVGGFGLHFVFFGLGRDSGPDMQLTTAAKVLVSLFMVFNLGVFAAGATLAVLLNEDYETAGGLMIPVCMLVVGGVGINLSFIRLCPRSWKTSSTPKKKAEDELVEQWEKTATK